MPRDAVYYHDFTDADGRTRYRWEMIPCDVSALTTPITYIAMPTVILSTAGGDGQFDEDVPLGLPLSGEHKLTVSLDNADADLRSYILSPSALASWTAWDSVAAAPVTLNGLQGVGFISVSNLWTLYSDCGDSSLATTEFAILFQGVQKKEFGQRITGGVIEITLTDIASAVLSDIPWNDRNALAYGMLSTSLIFDNDYSVATGYTAKTSRAFFDELYKNEDGNVFGKIDIIDHDNGDFYILYWYRLIDLYECLHKFAGGVYSLYTRNVNISVSTTSSPLAAVTRYRLDYTRLAERGAALNTNELYVAGYLCVADFGAGTPAANDAVAGYLHKSDETGAVSRYRNAKEWLHDHVESHFAQCVPGVTGAATMSFYYKRLEDAPVTRTLELNDIEGDADDIIVDTAAVRLRGCDATLPGMDANSVRELSYSLESRRDNEGTYAITFPLHSNMTSLSGDNNDKVGTAAAASGGYSRLILSSISATLKFILAEATYFADKIGYFDTPAFSTEEFCFLPHRSATVSTGVTSYDDTYAYAFPFNYSAQKFTNRVIAIQRDKNTAFTVAKAITETLSAASQTRIECSVRMFKGGAEFATLNTLGQVYTFDATGIRSYYSALPTSYILTYCEPDYEAGIAKCRFLGLA